MNDEKNANITEYVLLGKKKDKLELAYMSMQSAKNSFEQLFNGIIFGLGHDPDDEDCQLANTKDGGLKIVFGHNKELPTKE